IDAESRALVDRLAADVARERILLVLSTRPVAEVDMPVWPDMIRLDLAPLSTNGTDALLQALLGSSATLAPLKELLARRTDGNPFFLQESVRALAETGVIAGERGAYRLEKPLGTIHIPDRVQALLAARVDRLEELDKGLLQAVAVIGRDA